MAQFIGRRAWTHQKRAPGSSFTIARHGSHLMSDQLSQAVATLQPELWTLLLNQAMKIYITATDGSAQVFAPMFTYPIFGDAESIFGYRELQILVCFDSVTFLPFLNVKYKQALPNTDVDVKAKMLEYLPPSTVYKDEAAWRDAIDAEQAAFEIPGVLVHEWQAAGETYGVYQVPLATERGRELLARVQILVLLFIEAGLYIDVHDPLWDFYVLYRTTQRQLPEVVGFTTAYNYWVYPGHERFDAGVTQIRKKILQFVILPIHQGKRLGSRLYRSLYEKWLADDRILEIVVEDPNESFDDMRDRTDFARLSDLGVLKGLHTHDVTPKLFASVKAAHKLEKRQLLRLFEMAFLHSLKQGCALDSKKEIRLFIKKRLYEKNREALVGMDEPTRLDKLHTAYEALEDDYYRILGPLAVPKRTAEGHTPNKRQKTSAL